MENEVNISCRKEPPARLWAIGTLVGPQLNGAGGRFYQQSGVAFDAGLDQPTCRPLDNHYQRAGWRQRP
jgi:hypothetical protein